jgi:uncharacterized protein YoaH (UPF0181 family)
MTKPRLTAEQREAVEKLAEAASHNVLAQQAIDLIANIEKKRSNKLGWLRDKLHKWRGSCD